MAEAWKNDPAIKDYFAWAKQYYDGDAKDAIVAFGYQLAQALEYVLRKAGSDLTRENVMRIATYIEKVEFPMLLPGIRAKTGADDFYPIEQLQMMQFDGQRWVPFEGIEDSHE